MFNKSFKANTLMLNTAKQNSWAKFVDLNTGYSNKATKKIVTAGFRGLQNGNNLK
jgi:hypothetical protein